MALLGTWEQTKLWERICKKKSPESDSVRATLTTCMPNIELVLNKGSTSPTDFTLHDADHSFRVSERMVDLIPSDTLDSLSTYELTLLLLSAYLHDIGMTPEKSKINPYYKLLLSGDKQTLDEAEVDTFQDWIDNLNDEVSIPLQEGTSTSETLGRAEFLTAYYCRDRHVRWGEEWIANNLNKYNLGNYNHWIEDLISLCSSHHVGYKELIKSHFNPKLVSGQGDIVHLRYLALILRVADVLEFDPERTPEVIFQHRDIHPKSIQYWYKDHEVALRYENDQLTIVAQPRNAGTHRAIEIMADEIEAELQLGRKLDDNFPFERCTFQKSPLPYKWDLKPDIRRVITPYNDSYEYIDGSFRPDTKKVLQLFSGKELYGDEMLAVRELLQNAIDAIREQIAYERLQKADPENPDWEKKLGDMHCIKLTLEKKNEELWLECQDDGVGMTKDIIRKYLLVSGTAHHPDIYKLERRCEKNDFHLNRTGQFGIGVLSYFMLADKVQVFTRRSLLPGDSESNGWVFETDGVGTFGELKKDYTEKQGTKIKLRLQKKYLSEPKIIYSKLKYQIREICRRLPCNLTLECSFIDETLRLECGWTISTELLTDLASSSLNKTRFFSRLSLFNEPDEGVFREDLVSSKLKTKIEELKSHQATKKARIKKYLDWVVEEGELPHKVGSYRIHIPVFNLSAGPSIDFINLLKDEKQISFDIDNDPHFFQPSLPSQVSWKGFKVENCNIDISRLSFFTEIDLTNSKVCEIRVDRSTLKLKLGSFNLIDWIKSRVSEIYKGITHKNIDSPFNTLSYRFQPCSRINCDKLYWAFFKSETPNKLVWEKIQFPAIDLNEATSIALRTKGDTFKIDDEFTFSWRKKSISPLMVLDTNYDLQSRSGVSFADLQFSPTYIAQLELRSVYNRLFSPISRGLIGVWDNKEKLECNKFWGINTCLFPPVWNNVVGICNESIGSFSSQIKYWNQKSSLLDIGNDDIAWICKVFDDRDLYNFPNPIPRFKDFEGKPKRRLAWLARVFLGAITGTSFLDKWDALIEKEKGFLNQVWEDYFQSKAIESPLLILGDRSSLIVLSPSESKTIEGKEEIIKFVPDPGPEWTIEVLAKK